MLNVCNAAVTFKSVVFESLAFASLMKYTYAGMLPKNWSMSYESPGA